MVVGTPTDAHPEIRRAAVRPDARAAMTDMHMQAGLLLKVGSIGSGGGSLTEVL
jgi:hypothetical protein